LLYRIQFFLCTSVLTFLYDTAKIKPISKFLRKSLLGNGTFDRSLVIMRKFCGSTKVIRVFGGPIVFLVGPKICVVFLAGPFFFVGPEYLDVFLVGQKILLYFRLFAAFSLVACAVCLGGIVFVAAEDSKETSHLKAASVAHLPAQQQQRRQVRSLKQ
jgi:hypothetical protein